MFDFVGSVVRSYGGTIIKLLLAQKGLSMSHMGSAGDEKMTHAECMKSNSKEATRVREILTEIENVKFPEDTILWQLLQKPEVNTE